MTLDLDSWRGLVVRPKSTGIRPVLAIPLQQSARGGSGTFLAADSERRQWWVKPVNNIQGGKVIVSEQVAGRAGALIGAPVCDVAVVEIPSELTGWEFRPGSFLEPGFAHGSLAVTNAVEDRQLSYTDRDENAARHVGVFAMHDWCWGGDSQWLYAESEDRKLYSHDHGWYFPETGKDWTIQSLDARSDETHTGPWSSDDLDHDEVDRMADALRAVQRSDLCEVLSEIPETWPATDEELEAVGCFLEHRASRVADRLIGLKGKS